MFARSPRIDPDASRGVGMPQHGHQLIAGRRQTGSARTAAVVKPADGHLWCNRSQRASAELRAGCVWVNDHIPRHRTIFAERGA